MGGGRGQELVEGLCRQTAVIGRAHEDFIVDERRRLGRRLARICKATLSKRSTNSAPTAAMTARSCSSPPSTRRALAEHSPSTRRALAEHLPSEWSSLDVRLISIEGPDDKTAYFISSLSTQDASRDDLAGVYCLRWDAEDFFMLLKSDDVGQVWRCCPMVAPERTRNRGNILCRPAFSRADRSRRARGRRERLRRNRRNSSAKTPEAAQTTQRLPGALAACADDLRASGGSAWLRMRRSTEAARRALRLSHAVQPCAAPAPHGAGSIVALDIARSNSSRTQIFWAKFKVTCR